MKTITRLLLAFPVLRLLVFGELFLLLFLAAPEATARPNIRLAFFTFYTNAVGSKLDNLPSKAGHCGVCHYDFNGGGTKNPYGNAILNSGYSLTSDTGRSNAVWSVRNIDSDGDGFTTQTEVTNTASYGNTPTFPGLQSSNVNSVVNIPVSEVLPYITPTTATDTTPPVVNVLTPNGGQTFTGNRATNITWSATDASGIASVNLYVSLDNGTTYQPIALGLGECRFVFVGAGQPPDDSGTIKVVATDTSANSTNDVSDAAFTIVSPPGGRCPVHAAGLRHAGHAAFPARAAIWKRRPVAPLATAATTPPSNRSSTGRAA